MPTATATMSVETTSYLTRLRAGEEGAFERMVKDHIDRLFAYARRMLNSESDAADAVQEGFMDARRGLCNFRGDSKLTTWLHRIVHRRCLGIIRKRKPHLDVDELADVIPDERMDTAAPAEKKAMAELLKEQIDDLPQGQREAISLHYFSELSYDEVAKTMGRPIGTVRTHLHRGKSALRKALSRRGIEHNG